MMTVIKSLMLPRPAGPPKVCADLTVLRDGPDWLYPCPKEPASDPMLRTVRGVPDCPTAGVNYLALRTVKSIHAFGGPTVVWGIRDFIAVRGHHHHHYHIIKIVALAPAPGRWARGR